MITKILRRIAVGFLIGLVQLYRHTISVVFPPSCRYTPTCSQYAIDALNKYGAIRGTVKAATRILRCHPYSHHSSYDPIK